MEAKTVTRSASLVLLFMEANMIVKKWRSRLVTRSPTATGSLSKEQAKTEAS